MNWLKYNPEKSLQQQHLTRQRVLLAEDPPGFLDDLSEQRLGIAEPSVHAIRVAENVHRRVL